jgi:U3 small nucleolar RNA-associated protein 10
VVPALVQSLRKQKRDVVSGTSELLLSFIAAFEHIPSHRRHRLFEALITRLGTHDFLFAVLAMLGNRHVTDKDVLSLMCSIASNNLPEMQLIVSFKSHDLI